MIKTKGPKIEPWGTPHVMLEKSVFLFFLSYSRNFAWILGDFFAKC